MKYDIETIVDTKTEISPLDAAIENSIKKELEDNSLFLGNYVSQLHYDENNQTFLVQHPKLDQVTIEVKRGISQISAEEVGCEFLVTCDRGEVTKPILLNKLTQLSISDERRLPNEKRIISAESELTLKCGKSSITLSENGKVVIRGSYILSRSSGANKIRGGSISLN